MSRHIDLHLPLRALEGSGNPDDARLSGTATILGCAAEIVTNSGARSGEVRMQHVLF